MSVTKSTTGQNSTERKLDTVQYRCYHHAVQRSRNSVHFHYTPIVLYLFLFTFEKAIERNTVKKHIEEPSEFIGTYRLQFTTD